MAKSTPRGGRVSRPPERRESGRRTLGGARPGAAFPAAPGRLDVPDSYPETLADIKLRIQHERLRVVVTANSVLVCLYWDIGRVILDRQGEAGWGAKVIDRLAADLRDAYPDKKGFSPRNLKYMRAFAAAWPDQQIVQRVIALLSWRHNIALLERLGDRAARLWYAERSIPHGLSQAINTTLNAGHIHEEKYQCRYTKNRRRWTLID
ncbi:MAG: hypothetical protein FJZ01_09555 [Candidatus Sericytochromatia bacterium]|nr:hypothetical protein [Candidatus Tanganyikabacteria bacterium]